MCKKKIVPLITIPLALTKKRILNVYSLGAYQTPLRELVLRKLRHDILASKQLGALITEQLKIDMIYPEILIPIPLHWTRYASRGFNQAHEIAKVIGGEFNVPVKNLLTRHKRTKFQSKLNLHERIENVKNVFSVKRLYKNKIKNIIKDKHIVLIDDLFTTGATLKNCAKILLDYNPKKISAIVACRAL
jgi:ComF family protein